MESALKDMLEQVFAGLSFSLTEHGMIAPLYVMIMQDDSTIPIVIQNSQEMSMEMYSQAAVNAAHELDAKSMFFVCEQNMVSKKKDDPEIDALLAGSIRASQHPDREEYLTLIHMTANGECESLISKIHKDPMGTKYTDEKEWVDGSVTNMITPWKAGS